MLLLIQGVILQYTIFYLLYYYTINLKYKMKYIQNYK